MFLLNIEAKNCSLPAKIQNDPGTYTTSYSQESVVWSQGHKADISRSWLPTILNPR